MLGVGQQIIQRTIRLRLKGLVGGCKNRELAVGVSQGAFQSCGFHGSKECFEVASTLGNLKYGTRAVCGGAASGLVQGRRRDAAVTLGAGAVKFDFRVADDRQ